MKNMKPFLPDAYFYREILKDEACLEELKRRYGGFDPNLIETIENIPQGNESGLRSFEAQNTPNLNKQVILKNSERNVLPLKLFLKISEGSKRSKRSNRTPAENLKYQKKQMDFWNVLQLNAPLAFSCITHVNQFGNDYHYLVMEFWNDKVTHDRNILALEKFRRIISEELVLNTYGLDVIEKWKRQIDSERDFIIRDSLKAIKKFHIEGTRELDEGEGLDLVRTELKVFEPKSASAIKKYYLNKRGEFYLKQLNKHIDATLPENFLDNIEFLIEPFYKECNRFYSQGDEYLHHLQFTKFEGERRTGVIDADHVMMTIPGYSFSKVTTSHLLNLDFYEEMKFIEETFHEDKKRGYSTFANINDNLEGYSYNEFERDYLLTSIFTRLINMGKRAMDATDAKNVLGFSAKGYDSNNSHVKYPSNDLIVKEVTYPNVPASLDLQMHALDDRLEILSKYQHLTREDRRNFSKLAGMLKYARILR